MVAINDVPFIEQLEPLDSLAGVQSMPGRVRIASSSQMTFKLFLVEVTCDDVFRTTPQSALCQS